MYHANRYSDVLDQSLNDNNDNQDRENILEIRLQHPREAKAFALVALFQIFVEAPAELRHAEEQIDQRADRKQQVAYDKVLAVQNISAADDMEIAPDIVSEDAGQACDQNDHTVDQHRLFSLYTEGIRPERDDVLEYCHNRGEARKRHKQEEQRSPDPAAAHIYEYIRQCIEDQRRSVHLDARQRRNTPGR